MTAAGRGVIQSAFAEAVARHGDRPAVVGSGGAARWSYRQLAARVDAAAALLARVLGPEPRHVGFRLANSPAYVSGYFGALRAGHLPLLLDASFNRGEIDAIRTDCGLDALVLDDGAAEALALEGAGEPVALDAGDGRGAVVLPLERTAPPRFAARDSTRVCRFTSGTTGRPKCLEFRGEAVVAAARHWVAGTGMTGDDRTLCLAALSNGLAFNTSLLSTFLAGGELHFLAGPPMTRPVGRRIAADGITRLVAFPALYRNFAELGGAPEGGGGAPDLSSLAHAISAGAPLAPEVRAAFRERYRLDISDYYGIAETGPCTFERDPGHHAGLGEPLPGVELRIDIGPGDGGEDANGDAPGVGEVLVRTESMASGYLNEPGLFESRLDGDGFYRSGDRGRLVDGRLHLAGRTSDHVNVGGRKVDPVEVAELVRGLPGVADAVAFADRDLAGETALHLVLAGRGGGAAPAKRAVLAACRERLAPYKVPGLVTVVDEIPRNGIGKPRLALLRERLRAARPEPREETVA